jgi:hypothetical protein
MEATIATTDKKSGWYVELNNKPRKRIEISIADFDTLVLERDNPNTGNYLKVIFGTLNEKDEYMKKHWLKINVTLDTDQLQINVVNDLNEIISTDIIFSPIRMLQIS